MLDIRDRIIHLLLKKAELEQNETFENFLFTSDKNRIKLKNGLSFYHKTSYNNLHEKNNEYIYFDDSDIKIPEIKNKVKEELLNQYYDKDLSDTKLNKNIYKIEFNIENIDEIVSIIYDCVLVSCKYFEEHRNALIEECKTYHDYKLNYDSLFSVKRYISLLESLSEISFYE